MLPGTLAGQFRTDEMEIDLNRLTSAAGASLILSDVAGVDWEQRTLHMADSNAIRFDAMSIGVGSVPVEINTVHPEQVVPIKPMQTFLKRLAVRLIRRFLVLADNCKSSSLAAVWRQWKLHCAC